LRISNKEEAVKDNARSPCSLKTQREMKGRQENLQVGKSSKLLGFTDKTGPSGIRMGLFTEQSGII
jgi:hypothetical protein